MLHIHGRAGENPYLAGQSKWDSVYKGVDMATGNFSASGDDLTFEGGYGIPVNVTRTYSANNGDEGPLGKGWSLSVDVRSTAGGLLKSGPAPVRSIPMNFKERPVAQDDPNLATEPVEAVTASDAGGREETIQKDVDGILTTPPWDKNVIDSTYETVVQGATTYQLLTGNTVLTPEGTTFVYQKKGYFTNGETPWDNPSATATPANVLKIVSATDRHGNQTTYTYGTGTITFAKMNGQTTENPLTSIQMPNGHEIDFTWGNGTNAPTNRIVSAGDGVRTVSYGYTSGLLTSATTPAGKTTTYAYGDVTVSARDPYQGGTPYSGSMASNVLVTITDCRGMATSISYMMGNLRLMPYGGLAKGVLVYQLSEPNGLVNSYNYDGAMHPSAISTSGSYTTAVVTEVGSYGGSLVDAASVTGQPGTSGTYRFSSSALTGNAGMGQGFGDGHTDWVTIYEGSTMNLLSDTRYTFVDTQYEKFGALAPTTYFSGTKIGEETTYNFMGNPLKKDYKEFTSYGDLATPVRTFTTEYAYWGKDKYYQRKAVKDPGGRYGYTDYYDSSATQGKKGQVYRVYDSKRAGFYNDTSITPPPGTPTGNYWKYQLKPSDPSAYSVQLDYDSKGRQIDVWKIQKTTTSPWTYVRTHTDYGSDSSPAWGAATSTTEDYGGLNRTTQTLQFDTAGRAVKVEDPLGRQFLTTYDADGQVQSVYRVDGSHNDAIASYSYGTSGITNGVLTQAVDGQSGITQTFSYQSTSGGGLGEISTATETNGSDVYSTTYTYSSKGDRATAVYQTPAATYRWGYGDYLSIGCFPSRTRTMASVTELDSSGNPTSEQFQYVYDTVGRVIYAMFAQTPTSGHVDYTTTYPARSRAHTTNTYDEGGRLTNTSTYWDAFDNQNNYTTVPILGNTCSYELTGLCRKLKTQSQFYTASGSSWSLQRTETYGYDADLDYLTSASYGDGLPNASVTWTYDAAGNRASDSSNSGTWTYDNLNRMTASPGISYTNDLLGNRLTKGSTSYTWDNTNRMTGLGSSTYQYRMDGMRAQKSVGSVTTAYRYDGQMPVEVVDTNGSAVSTTSNALGKRGIERIKRIDSGGTVIGYPIYDAHGSMVATLGKNGNGFTLGDQRSYDAWGTIRSGNTTGDPKNGYCASIGHIQDDESGLINMRARFYEPTTGRFISQDPSHKGDNWFTYCRNNPVSYVDKAGRELDWDKVKEDLRDSFIAMLLFILAAGDAQDSLDIENAWGDFMKVWGSGYLASDDAYWDYADKRLWIETYLKGGPGAVIKQAMQNELKTAGAIVAKLGILIVAYAVRLEWYIEDIDNF